MIAERREDSKAAGALRRHELIAWILFPFSALFFVLSAVRAGDTLGLVGALLFLAACIVFLVPRTLTQRTD